MIVQYCRIPSLYPGKNPLREYLAQIPDGQQRLDVLQREYGGRTPLHWATRQNHHTIITVMLESLPPVDRLIMLKTRDWTPLHDAARWNNAEAVRAILDCLTPEQQRELVSMWDEDGETAAAVAKRMRLREQDEDKDEDEVPHFFGIAVDEDEVFDMIDDEETRDVLRILQEFQM